MAILELDTDQLRSAVSAAEKANSELTEAMNFLNQVVEHNDWVCPERDQLNENTRNNKQTAGTIQENSNSFYNAIKTSSERFDEVEKGNITRTNNVDNLIAAIVNVVRGSFSTGGSAPAIGTFSGLSGVMKDNGSGSGGGHGF